MIAQVVLAAVAGLLAAVIVPFGLRRFRAWRLRRRELIAVRVVHGLGAGLYFARRTHDHQPGRVCPVPECYWPVA